jgi:Rab-like protein 2
LPIIVVGNKVDVDPSRAKKALGFVERRKGEREESRRKENGSTGGGGGKDVQLDGSGEEDMPVFLCSASDGTNVVGAFKEAIRRAVQFKDKGEKGGTFVDEVLKFIEEEERTPGGLFSASRQGENEDGDVPAADKDGSPLDSVDNLNGSRRSLLST